MSLSPHHKASARLRQVPWLLLSMLGCFVACLGSVAYCDSAILPGSDHFEKLTAAGDLFKTLDSFVFRIGARLLAGLCVLGAGWNLKEQRFATAVICVVAAIVIATVPMWIKNIFEIGGGSIFTPPSGG